MTYDGSVATNNLKFYFGGTNTAVAQMGTTASIAANLLGAPSQDFCLSYPGYLYGPIKGYMDNIRIYNTVLSQTNLEARRSTDVSSGGGQQQGQGMKLQAQTTKTTSGKDSGTSAKSAVSSPGVQVAVSAGNTVSMPVGVVRVDVPASGSALASLPFDALGLKYGINDVLGNQLTGAAEQGLADRVRLLAGQAQISAYKGIDGLWHASLPAGAASQVALLPGSGFVIDNRQAVLQSVYLCGRIVPDSTYSTEVAQGVNLVGSPFFATTLLNDLGFGGSGAHAALTADKADTIQVPDVTEATGVATYGLKLSDNQWHRVDDWTGAAVTDALRPGQGFQYNNVGSALNWVAARPYSWPFVLNENPPVVTAMSVDAKGNLSLSVQTTGAAGEKLEVYYKNLSDTRVLTSGGWSVAALDMATAGKQSITWVDDGSTTGGKVNTVTARCYLIGRGDIDSDGDGIPDARKAFVTGGAK